MSFSDVARINGYMQGYELRSVRRWSWRTL